VTEGGVRVPAIISYSGVNKPGTRNTAFSSILDLAPTVLEYAGVKHPSNPYNGRLIFPLEGKSLRPLLMGKSDRIYSENDPRGYELFGSGNRALIEGDWKILKLKQPFGDDQWKLFHLTEDPRELIDLSKQYPERLGKMIPLYEKYEKEKGVVSTPKEIYDRYDEGE